MSLLEIFCVFILAQGIYAGTLSEHSIPGQPQLVTVEITSATSAKISWFPPADQSVLIRGYKIGYGQNVPEENYQQLDVHVLEYEITDLDPGATYAIVVRAFNNRGEGIPVYDVITQPADAGSNETEISLTDKEASQSNTHDTSKSTADKAIDGDTDGVYNEGSCTHTRGGSASHWWMVDMGSDQCVGRVELYNRIDCCVDRLDGAVVRVGPNADRNNQDCGIVTTEQITTDQKIELSCGISGRYLSVETTGTEPLTLCEVKAFTGTCNSDGMEIKPDENSCKDGCYLGCFSDVSSPRAVPDNVLRSNSMTISTCATHCSEAGFRYFALQHHTACWCGSDGVAYDIYGVAPESECNLECRGDATQMCGGAWRNAVYDLQGDSPGGSPGTNGGIPDGNSGGLVAPILSVTDSDTSAISLSWTGIEGASDQRVYLLRYKTKPPSTWENIRSRDTSYTIENLEPNTLYQFEVKVETTEDESPYSLAVFQRTSDGPVPSPGSDTTLQPNGQSKCEPVEVQLCNPALIPYNVTVLPNIFGHTSQDEINGEIQKWFPVAVTGCSIMIGLLVCSTYVPPCTILEVPIPPCREICTAVRNDCEGVMTFPWPDVLNCDNFPSESDTGAICISPDVMIPPGVLDPGTGGHGGGNPGGLEHCEPLQIEMCNSPEIPYNYTMYPVTIGSTTITDQDIAMYETMMFQRIIESGCSPVLRFIVCSTIAPICNPLGVPILPCRELCEIALEQCQGYLESSGTSWPESYQCENFPQGPPGPDNQCLGFISEEPGSGTTTPDGSQVCEEKAAGLEDGSLGDELLSASSEYGAGPDDRGAKSARLNGNNFWASAYSDRNMYHYLQIDLMNNTVVKGIRTQGSAPNVWQWVKTFEIELGDDEDLLLPIQANGSVLSFTANTDATSVVNITFPEPVTTRILRIVPTDWQGWIAMRLEVILEVCTDVPSEEESTDDKDRKTDGDEPIYLRPDIQRGTAQCQEFYEGDGEGVLYHCPGLEYNTTFFPNSLGHADQEEAIATIEMLRDVTDIMGRMCPANQLLCVMLFPPCKEFGDDKAAPLLPCREECTYAKSECGAEVDFDEAISELSKWHENLNCELFPEKYSSPPQCWETTNAFLLDTSSTKPDGGDGDKGTDDKDRKNEGDGDKDRKNEGDGGDAGGDTVDGGDTGKDESACSTDIPEVCSDIGFKSTLYPNKIGHEDGTEALSVYEELQPAFDSMCSPELRSFVCAGLFPVCNETGAVFLPCHESCRHVWKACKDTFADLGLDRPKVLSCNKYYEPVETDPTCLSSFNMPTKAPKLKNIDRQATNAKLVLWPEDDNAQYFKTKLFSNQDDGPSGPSREKKFDVSTETKTTSVTYEDILPNVTYYAHIKTGNLFGESPSIFETVPKFEGVSCHTLEIDMCRGFGYDMALKDGTPNLLGHIDQAESFDNLIQFDPLIKIECSDQLQKFLCWLFVPGCSLDLNEVVPPCRETCEASRDGCEPSMRIFGFEWPEILDCEQFPYSNESSCENTDGLRYKGTRDSDGVSDYVCTKLFNSDPETPVKWYNPEGEEIISEDQEDVMYIEKLNERMTRLIISEYNADVAGKYTCRSGDLEIGPDIEYTGECYSNDHHICSQLYDSFNLPNSAGQTDPREALLSTNVFLPLMVSGCSEYINQFACYTYLPNTQCSTGSDVNGTFERNEWGYGTTTYPCRELCYKVQQDCEEVIGEIGFVWPEDVTCDALPLRSSNECDHYGVSELDIIAVNFTDSTNDTDTDFINATDIYPTEMVTELYTEETDTNTTMETPTNDTDSSEPAGVCTGLKARRYDMEELGSDCLFRGFVDVQAQGAANDYCRVVKQSGPQFLSCALAGDVEDHVYTSPNASIDWFDAGYTDTWYMKDEDGDGRDDYCRCVGVSPDDTIVSCMKAGIDGFIGFDDFQIEGSTGCEYNKVNPFFGAP